MLQTTQSCPVVSTSALQYPQLPSGCTSRAAPHCGHRPLSTPPFSGVVVLAERRMTQSSCHVPAVPGMPRSTVSPETSDRSPWQRRRNRNCSAS